MTHQKMLDSIRQNIVDSLERSIRIYTRNGTRAWLSERTCRELIAKLEKKEPVQMAGPFWGDFIGVAIREHGFPDFGLTKKEHFEIWVKIESGE